MFGGGEFLENFAKPGSACFRYLGDMAFVFLECLVVINSQKSLLNLGLKYY